MRYFIFAAMSLVLLTVSVGCDNDDDEMMPEPMATYKDIDVVTGLYLLDENASPLGRWRGPNDKRGDAVAFPNPCTGQLAFFSDVQYDRVWLLPANCLIDTVIFDIPGHASSLNFPVAQVDSASIKQWDLESGQQQVILNFEDVETGFYKLFYAEDGELPYWQNVFIDPTVNNFPTLGFLEDLCQ